MRNSIENLTTILLTTDSPIINNFSTLTTGIVAGITVFSILNLSYYLVKRLTSNNLTLEELREREGIIDHNTEVINQNLYIIDELEERMRTLQNKESELLENIKNMENSIHPKITEDKEVQTESNLQDISDNVSDISNNTITQNEVFAQGSSGSTDASAYRDLPSI
jgi:hypothetical protein